MQKSHPSKAVVLNKVIKNDTEKDNTETTVTRDKTRWRWYHALLLHAGTKLLSYGLSKVTERLTGNDSTRQAQDEFYENLELPVFAPPGPAFPAVWAINNAARTAGMVRVLNLPEETEGRKTYLVLQGVSLVNYASFNPVYFGLRSPTNGAVLSVLDTGVNLASLYVALSKLEDTQTALSLSTIVPWLGLASAVSVTVAAWNEDAFYGTQARAKPLPDWVKGDTEARP